MPRDFAKESFKYFHFPIIQKYVQYIELSCIVWQILRSFHVRPGHKLPYPWRNPRGQTDTRPNYIIQRKNRFRQPSHLWRTKGAQYNPLQILKNLTFVFSVFKKIEGEIRAAVDEATKKAKADSEIGNEELTADIYTNNLEGEVRGVTPFQGWKHLRIGAAVNQ